MNVIDMKRDHVVRATAANGTIRAFAVYSRGLVEDARRMHELSRTATAALGRTLTAAAMMGTMMKGDKDALSIVFNGDGSLGNITVTAKSDGSVKGYVGNPQASLPSKVGEKLRVGEVVGKGTRASSTTWRCASPIAASSRFSPARSPTTSRTTSRRVTRFPRRSR